MKLLHASVIAVVLAAFLSPDVAHADPIVSLTFNPSVQSIQQGGLLTFSGVLSVAGDPDTIFLTGDSVTPSPGFGIVGFDIPTPDLLMLDDLPFFLNFPSQISSNDPGNPWTFDFFTVDVGPQVLPGTYLGSFSILGGTFAGAQDILASADFQIDVAAAPASEVPEPGTLALLCAGLIVLGAHRISRRQPRFFS